MVFFFGPYIWLYFHLVDFVNMVYHWLIFKWLVQRCRFLGVLIFGRWSWWRSGIARPPYLVGSDGSLHSLSEQMCSSVIDGINLKWITFLKVWAFPLIPESFSWINKLSFESFCKTYVCRLWFGFYSSWQCI